MDVAKKLHEAQEIKEQRKELLKEERALFKEALELFCEKNNLTGNVVCKKSGERGRIKILKYSLSDEKPWLYFYPYLKSGVLAANPANKKLMLPPILNRTLSEMEPKEIEKLLNEFATYFEPSTN